MRTLSKWFVGSLIVVIAVFLALQFIVTPWLEFKAEKVLQESANDRFRLTASNIQIDLFRRSLRADSSNLFVILPATDLDTTSDHEMTMQLKSIHASGINVWQLLMNKKLAICELHLVQPHFQITRKNKNHVKKALEQGKANILEISISDLRLDSSSLIYADSPEASGLRMEIASIQGALKYLMPHDDSPAIDPGETYLEFSNGSARLPGGYYDVEFLQCNISGKESNIHIDSLKLIPLLDKYEFSQKYGYKIDRVSMNVSEININDFDAGALIDNKGFNARMLSISDVDFDIFRDARRDYAPWRHTQLLQRELSQFPFIFAIDSLNIKDGYIRYEEKRFDELNTGHLELENISISGNRLTNDPLLMKESVFKANGEALFMGYGKLNANMQFSLDKLNGHHLVSGHLGPMPIPTVNTVLYPLTKFSIESGENDNVYFNMSLDEVNATGDLRFYYHDLKVDMRTEKEKWINDVSSFLANNIIRSENPKNGKFRRGIISYERDIQQSIFNYWWKSLRSGLMTSVGISPGIKEKE